MGLSTHYERVSSPTFSGVIVVAACAAALWMPREAPQLPVSHDIRPRQSGSETVAETSRATESTQFLVSVSAASLDAALALALHSVFLKMIRGERELDGRAKAIFYESLPDMYRQ